MKISFDFDETLSETWFQRLARALITAGVDVRVVTSRCSVSTNKDLWAIVDYLQIPVDNVHFTEGRFKAEILERNKIDIHFDDNMDEINVIRMISSCKAVNLVIPE